jgi:protein-disulfide isomerase-like protein with CxxC motif
MQRDVIKQEQLLKILESYGLRETTWKINFDVPSEGSSSATKATNVRMRDLRWKHFTCIFQVVEFLSICSFLVLFIY